MSISPISSQMSGVSTYLQPQSGKNSVSSLLDGALGLARNAIGQGANSVSISAQSLNLDIQSGNRSLSIQYTRFSMVASFGANESPGLGLMNYGDIKDLLDTAYSFAGVTPQVEGAEITTPPQGVQEYWSVENTANRIADFALSNYLVWLGENENTAEARQEYVDYIGKAVQKGFDEAQEILTGLSPIIDENVANMHDIVFGRLQDFVEEEETPSAEALAQAMKDGRMFLEFVYNLPLNQRIDSETGSQAVDLFG